LGLGCFWPFLAIFERFWHYWGFDGDSGVLGVPVSYRITRGDKLVVGRVNEEVKGGFEGVLGGLGRSRGSKGVCLTPIGHVLPLWKSCRALNLVPNPIKWSN
jgi:hypothetical protein